MSALSIGDVQPTGFTCDVCGDYFDDEDPHMPCEPGCGRGRGGYCSCDLEMCADCCFDCNGITVYDPAEYA